MTRPKEEPKTLDSLGAWRDIILLAQYEALGGDIKEAARMMTRLFTEASLNDCERLLMTATDLWLASANLPAQEAELIRSIAATVGAEVAKNNFHLAHALLKDVVTRIKLEPGPSMRFGLMALGIKGAAARKKA